jgi:hypothetical protein
MEGRCCQTLRSWGSGNGKLRIKEETQNSSPASTPVTLFESIIPGIIVLGRNVNLIFQRTRK